MTGRRLGNVLLAIAGIVLVSHVQVAGSATSARPGGLPRPSGSPPPAIQRTTDAFDRSVDQGWGSTADGGVWRTSDDSTFTVSNGIGRISLQTPGALRSALIPNLQLSSVELSFRVAHDKPVGAGGQYVYLVARRIEPDLEYRVKIRFAKDGALFVQPLRLVNAKEEALADEVAVPSLNAGPGAFIRIRAQVSGLNPTTVAIRAWPDGSLEPTDWIATATDATPALQAAGAVGVRAYLAARTTNAPVVISVDDFSAR